MWERRRECVWVWSSWRCVFVCDAVCQTAYAAVFVVSCGGGQWDGSRQHHTDSYSTSTRKQHIYTGWEIQLSPLCWNDYLVFNQHTFSYWFRLVSAVDDSRSLVKKKLVVKSAFTLVLPNTWISSWINITFVSLTVLSLFSSLEGCKEHLSLYYFFFLLSLFKLLSFNFKQIWFIRINVNRYTIVQMRNLFILKIFWSKGVCKCFKYYLNLDIFSKLSKSRKLFQKSAPVALWFVSHRKFPFRVVLCGSLSRFHSTLTCCNKRQKPKKHNFKNVIKYCNNVNK